MTGSESLLDKIKQRIDSGKLKLPVFNETAAKCNSLSMDENVDTAEIEKLVLDDQVLVAEILRSANSPFFGGLAEVHTVQNAIVRLGLQQVARLVLLASQRSEYDTKDPELRKLAQRMWEHASATAMASGWLMRKLGFGKVLESEAFLGGLLHDVGKLVIVRAIDEIQRSEKAPVDLSVSFLDEVVRTAHMELGFSLLTHWGIPDVYRQIARDHHLKDFNSANVPLVAVRLADTAASKVGISLHPEPSLVLSTFPEAHCLNAGEILLAELEILLEDSFPQVAGAHS